MKLQDIFPAAHIRSPHADLTVKTPRTENRRIQDIHTVGRRHNDDAFIHTEAIHFHKQLIQGLLPFIMAAAHAGASASCHSVNFIDKYNTG